VSAEDPRKRKEPVLSLPAQSLDAVGFKLTPSGIPITDSLIQQATDSLLFWRVQVADGGGGGAPAWVFVAAPSCADIASTFGRCDDLANAIATCAALQVYGYS
jgi:hypothetical protein